MQSILVHFIGWYELVFNDLQSRPFVLKKNYKLIYFLFLCLFCIKQLIAENELTHFYGINVVTGQVETDHPSLTGLIIYYDETDSSRVHCLETKNRDVVIQFFYEEDLTIIQCPKNIFYYFRYSPKRHVYSRELWSDKTLLEWTFYWEKEFSSDIEAEYTNVQTTYPYDCNSCCSIQEIPPEKWSHHCSIEYDKITNEDGFSNSYSLVSGLFYDLCHWLTKQKEKFSLTDSLSFYCVDFLENQINQGFLKLAGFYTQPIVTGTIGEGEINNHIRISLVNGMGNLNDDVVQSAYLISSTHGNINVHYVFRPTEGWTRDLFNCLFTKLGYSSLYSQRLASHWRSLMQDIDNDQGDKLIIHYAHSLGGTDTSAALKLLTDEEQNILKVITIGSATIVPKEDFKNSINFVSYYDIVPMIADPIHYIYGLVSSKSNVFYLGNCQGYPFIDHTLSAGTYRDLILFLGDQFTRACPLIPIDTKE